MEPKVRKSGDCICKTPQSCGLGLTETALSKGFPDISAGSVITLSQFPEMSSGKEKIFFSVRLVRLVRQKTRKVYSNMNWLLLSAETPGVIRDENGVPIEWILLKIGENNFCQNGKDGVIKLSKLGGRLPT